MEFLGKEVIWINELNIKSEDVLQQEITTLQIETHNCELQAFCTKLFLKLKKISQECNDLQTKYNKVQIECDILKDIVRKNLKPIDE